MNEQANNNNEHNEYLVPGYSSGHFSKWLALSLLLICGLLYMAYSFGSNENQRQVNRLNKQLQSYGEVESLDDILTQFQAISRDIKLSNNERAKFTALLDQLIFHKTSLEQSEQDLKLAKRQLAELNQNYQTQLQNLEQKNQQLENQVAQLESVMSYTSGTVQRFTLALSESNQLIDNSSSRVALIKVLNAGSAQVNVGNALMFFHLGHTLRFRFAPNWLCDVTLVKISDATDKVEFEYYCQIN